uniref:Transcriptional regulator n=1 Tax=Panagrellus redivivus TaxID=6233 RepID=A0A7E4V504_PANRE
MLWFIYMNLSITTGSHILINSATNSADDATDNAAESATSDTTEKAADQAINETENDDAAQLLQHLIDSASQVGCPLGHFGLKGLNSARIRILVETCLKLAADATRPIRQIAQNLIVSQVAVVQNGQEVADIGDRQALKERRRRDADAIAAAT